jgi:hypothetical protein
VQPNPHGDALGLALEHLPGTPAQQAVDGGARRRLAEGELVLDSVEAVMTVGEAVGPGNQDGAVGAVTHRVPRIGVQHRPAADGVRANAAADLHDRRALLAK